MAREKQGDCPNAVSTLGINTCLSHAVDATDRNYRAYVRAIGGLLRLHQPGAGSAPPEPPRGRELDAAEAAWATSGPRSGKRSAMP